MPAPKLLITDTISYDELIRKSNSYRVPPYQRDYSWTEEQWEDLWNDLVDLDRHPKKQHYLGALIVKASSGREFDVIDGQQRLATLSLLALAVIDRIQELARNGIDEESNKTRGDNLINHFIAEIDPVMLGKESKLHLNETDNELYQKFLVELEDPPNRSQLRGSNKLIWKCFEYFQGKLASRYNDGSSAAGFLLETVARHLLFILIIVNDELNAYTVFETLNSRGLKLTTTDLIKNHLFSCVGAPRDLERLQKRWGQLLEIVDPERFPEFLRYHLLCQKPKIRSRQLFRLIKDSTRNKKDVFALIDALEKRAELFAALSDPQHTYWVDLAIADGKKYIQELKLFGTSQATPLLFATREKFNDEDFLRVLKLVSVISFRYLVIDRRNTNELEPAYHYAAKAVLDGKDTTPAAVFGQLRSIYVNDEETRSNFESLSLSSRGRGKSLTRYILTRLEEDVSRIDRADQGTIEHILPENPEDNAWPHFSPQQRDELTSRLGNLTLLESTTNRKIGNVGYAEKVRAYAQSTYALTRQIAQDAPDIWTPEQIDRRQQGLAKRAVHLWRSDFA